MTPGDTIAVLPGVGLGLAPPFLLRWRLNLLTLAEEEAQSLGVDTRRLRLVVIAAATLMTAVCVAVSGMIGWIGLVIPHIARLLVGPDFGRLLPVAMLLGDAYLLGVDTIARTLRRDRDPDRRADGLPRRAVLPVAPGLLPPRLAVETCGSWLGGALGPSRRDD